METNITNGQNIIRILYDNFASCLIIEKAKVINWPDCRGSVGEYFSISNYSEVEKRIISSALDNALQNGDELEILKYIPDFLTLFSNGKYVYNFNIINFSDSEFHKSDEIEYSTETPQDERFSGHFYPFKDYNYFYTIKSDKIDLERVEYYKKLINKGVNPTIIIFDADFVNLYEYSSSYVIDGHHKIEAYLSLKKDIPALFIGKIENEVDSTTEILEKSYPILSKNEFDHLFLNSDNNLLGINFIENKLLTSKLDEILLNSKRIEVSVINLLIKYENSQIQIEKLWAYERIKTLKENKNLSFLNFSKGLTVWIKMKSEYGLGWHQKILRNQIELNSWINSTLKNKFH